jgi:hypothetical protein
MIGQSAALHPEMHLAWVAERVDRARLPGLSEAGQERSTAKPRRRWTRRRVRATTGDGILAPCGTSPRSSAVPTSSPG